MARRVSIHIGLNNLSNHYLNTPFGSLNSCIKDMEDMRDIAKSRSFEPPILLPNSSATVKNVTDSIKKYSKDGTDPLKKDDLLLITYSGHGDRRTDAFGNEESDRQDESWCLYDRQFWDDELFELWTEFNEGVRIVVISDSCHSGTIIDFIKLNISNSLRLIMKKKGFDFKEFEKQTLYEKGFDYIKFDEKTAKENLRIIYDNKILEKSKINLTDFTNLDFAKPKIRTFPEAVSDLIYESHKIKYDTIRSDVKERLRDKLILSGERDLRRLVKANVMLISACQDNEETADGKSDKENGAFTAALKSIWNNGNFQGSYLKFRDEISKLVEKTQKPNYYVLGPYNAAFESQNPFQINV